MSRPDWKKVFSEITEIVASRSTCARIKVGGLLVRDNRIISMGYNGVPEGQKHCEEHFKLVYKLNYYDEFKSFEDYLNSELFREEHRIFSERNELHAEANALIYAAKNGVRTQGSVLYISYSPCMPCSKLILQAGVKEVYFNKPYDRDISGSTFLMENGVPCSEIS